MVGVLTVLMEREGRCVAVHFFSLFRGWFGLDGIRFLKVCGQKTFFWFL